MFSFALLVKIFYTADVFKLTQRKGRCIQAMFDNSGKWVSTGTKNMDDAKKWAERHDDKSLFGTFAENFFLRDDECSIQYWNRRKDKYFSPGYYTVRQGVLDNHIMPFFKDYHLSEITPYLIDMWFFSLVTKHGKKETSNVTKNKYLTILSIVLKRAVYECKIMSNPCENVSLSRPTSKRERVSESDMAILFPHDLESELKIWGELRWLVIFNIMRCTGWRPGEIAGLDKSCYDPKIKGIKTWKSSTQFGLTDRIKTTGHGKSYKIGYLDEYTAEMLERYMDSIVDEQLFLEKNGRTTYCYYSNVAFRCALEKVGIQPEKYTQYCIRHRFMTRAKLALDREDTMELMGHTVWEECYDHTEADEQLKKMEKVKDSLLSVV